MATERHGRSARSVLSRALAVHTAGALLALTTAFAALAVIAMVSPAVQAADGASTAATETVPSHREIVTAATERAILPRLAAFRDAAASLSASAAQWCSAPGDAPPAALVDAFRATALAWGGISHLRFGPLRDQNRLPRIAFWPDPRGVVRRQTLKVLRDAKAEILAPGEIARHSAAIQGLPALEIILTLTPEEAGAFDAKHRCALAAAVAANVHTLAIEVDEGWRGPAGWQARLLSAGPDNLSYQNDAEAAAELLRSLLTGLQILGQQQITPWIESAQKSKSWAGLPFERSRLAAEFAQAELRALAELHDALAIEAVARRLGREQQNMAWIGSWLTNAYAALTRDTAQLVLPADLVRTPGTDIDPIRRVKFFCNGIRQLVGRQIAPAANILIGFNELDGD